MQDVAYPDGVLAFHISTRYLDLGPVLGGGARWRAVPAAATSAWTDDFSNILSVFKWSDTP